jgi:murein DD-endopeptidase MepM/ murein hydrolase activator NlpD
MKLFLRGWRSGLFVLLLLWFAPTDALMQMGIAARPATLLAAPNGLLPYHPSSSPRLTQDWHGLGGWSGYDYATYCGDVLYSPVNGVVKYNGLDGYNHVDSSGHVWPQNTMLVIATRQSEELVLLHGDYTVYPGQRLVAGQHIGYEASNGWSTGCHSHISYRVNGQAVDWKK